MGRYVRRPKSDFDLTHPRRLRPLPHGGLFTYQLSHTLRLIKNFLKLLFLNVINSLDLCPALCYSYATCKPYTRISSLHGKSLIGISQVYIQHHLLMPNSDSAEALNNCFYYDPTHTLLLLAITEALRLRFGLSTSPVISSHLLLQNYPQVSLLRFVLTYSSHLSLLVQ